MSNSTYCPVCCGRDVSVFLEIPQLPVFCNQLCHSREDALSAPVASIRLGFCSGCGHVYNVDFDPSLVEYSPEYENSLHFSPRFRTYAEDLAAALTARYTLDGKTIVEIGCGRGDFLKALCRQGTNRGLGFDPSYPGESGSWDPETGVTIFRQPYAEALITDNPALTCCRHCLEHIAQPRTFVQNLHTVLRTQPDGGSVFFEVPNALFILRDGSVWDIIYEHCGYFTAASLRRLFETSGFVVTDVAEAFGGQFLTLHADATTTPYSNTCQQFHHDIDGHIENFRNSFHNRISEWIERMDMLGYNQKRIVAWGSGSKANTFLNLVNASVNADSRIDYVVDINPHKQGRYVAGSGQSIVSPEFLKQYHPDIILVLNAIYQKEIRAMTEQLGINATIVCA